MVAIWKIMKKWKILNFADILFTANSYSQTTALLGQKGCTLDFAMAIGVILELAVPLLLKSRILYYGLL